MENAQKDWESLGLSNDFLFGKVMRNPELCKEMLELILGVEIERLEYPEAQRSINEEKDAKGGKAGCVCEERERGNIQHRSPGPGYRGTAEKEPLPV